MIYKNLFKFKHLTSEFEILFSYYNINLIDTGIFECDYLPLEVSFKYCFRLRKSCFYRIKVIIRSVAAF